MNLGPHAEVCFSSIILALGVFPCSIRAASKYWSRNTQTLERLSQAWVKAVKVSLTVQWDLNSLYCEQQEHSADLGNNDHSQNALWSLYPVSKSLILKSYCKLDIIFLVERYNPKFNEAEHLSNVLQRVESLLCLIPKSCLGPCYS